MNTKDAEQDENQQLDFVGGDGSSGVRADGTSHAVLMDNIARLELSLDTEQEERLEERFRWICSTALLVDVIAIVAIDGSWLFIPLFLLQLIFLIAAAKSCGVDWAVQLIGWLLYKVSNWGKPTN